jgi:hypothetical protein
MASALRAASWRPPVCRIVICDEIDLCDTDFYRESIRRLSSTGEAPTSSSGPRP